jgi:hypothetical protein
LSQHHLQHPRPTADPSVPFSPKTHFTGTAPASLNGKYLKVFSREKHIGLAEHDILVLEYGYYDFQNPPYMASPQLLITRIGAASSSFIMLILVSVGSVLGGDIQFVLQREAKSGKVWFSTAGMLPNETHAASTSRVLLRETGLPFSSDDL